MAGQAGTLETLAQQIGLALQPLETQLTSANIIPFLAELGLEFPPQLLTPAFETALNAGATAAGALPPTLTQLATDIENENVSGILADGLQLINEISAIITALGQIGTALHTLATTPGSLPGMNTGDVTTFATNLVENLLSYLLIDYVETIEPGVVGIANMLGVIQYVPNPGVSGDPTHPPFISRQLQLSNLGTLFSSPAALANTLFDWGSPSFDGTKLIPVLNTSINLLGLMSHVNPTGPPTSLTTSLLTIAANPATTPPGLLATVSETLPENVNLTLPLSPTWSVDLQMTGALAAGISATVIPPVSAALLPPSGTLNAQLLMNLIAQGADATHPLILVGETGGSFAGAASVSIGAGITVAWDSTSGKATADPSVTAAITNGQVVIDMADADGFLADVLSGVNVQSTFNLTATWRLDTGLHITGGAQLEIDLPLHIDLGPVDLETLYLVGGIASGGLTIEVSAALGITLGPIAASVDRVGLLGTLTFPSGGGNLGPANLVLGFKPPNGLGLAIDAGVIAGGGYISFDPSQGQYSGVIALSLLDTIGITVIVVLDTKMPDGSTGFALLFIITFTLPPIQLGFGFTLTGVGGLGGVNRAMSVSALQAGFMAHTLNDIMFPANPIQNAPQIISDIRNIFPVAEGRYLFGPLVQIGWGTPTLITFSIGCILSVPDPVVLALIGLIDAGLPTMDVALISLHIEVLGVIDFGAKTLSIQGRLYNSYILVYSVGGSLLFQLAWGDDPNFVFSLGGFNPNFNTDGLVLPQMARLSISIGEGDNPRISANSYYAVTSNSVQFGANVQAYASAGGFTIQGYLGFDVLFIISPFSFEFDFQASFSVKYDGVSLVSLSVTGAFTGPTPWHFQGSASISLLFFSVSASLSLTWGSSTQATIPSKPVLPDLFTALDNPESWSAALPSGAAAGASFVTLAPTDTTLRVHPMGTLTVRENVVPLDLSITKYGNATPSDGTEFSIQQVQINAQTESITTIPGEFAAGQFTTLSDSAKLSTPSFEPYDAGVTIGSTAVESGQDEPRTVTYQEFYIYARASFSQFSRFYQMPAAIHAALSAQGAGWTSPLKNTGLSKYSAGPQPTAVTITDPPYVVANVSDLSIRSDISSAAGTTYYEAQAAVQSYVAANPGATGTLQIVPVYETAA
jgi:hypothetical protein